MKLLLIDDHHLFRDAIALLIAQRFEGVAIEHASSLGEAKRALALHPGIAIALLDLALPDSRGCDGVRALRLAAPTTAVVVLSADERRETVLEAVDAGAAGFIPKTARPQELDAALRTVLDGRVFLPAATFAPLPAAAAPGELTARQLDVLRLLIAGRSNKLICRELALSESTVKTHLAAIFRKLGVDTRTQAVVAAARLGLRFGEPHALGA
ncbi:MAG TPA: response regulator transcription factor [Albitalea sp.]